MSYLRQLILFLKQASVKSIFPIHRTLKNQSENSSRNPHEARWSNRPYAPVVGVRALAHLFRVIVVQQRRVYPSPVDRSSRLAMLRPDAGRNTLSFRSLDLIFNLELLLVLLTLVDIVGEVLAALPPGAGEWWNQKYQLASVNVWKFIFYPLLKRIVHWKCAIRQRKKKKFIDFSYGKHWSKHRILLALFILFHPRKNFRWQLTHVLYSIDDGMSQKFITGLLRVGAVINKGMLIRRPENYLPAVLKYPRTFERYSCERAILRARSLINYFIARNFG